MENIETANPSTPILSKRKNVFRTPQNRKRKMVNDNISSISAVIDKLDNVVQNNKNETDNEFDIFGKHIAVQLKEMPLYDAIMCQEQIQTIMRETKTIGTLNKTVLVSHNSFIRDFTYSSNHSITFLFKRYRRRILVILSFKSTMHWRRTWRGYATII